MKLLFDRGTFRIVFDERLDTNAAAAAQTEMDSYLEGLAKEGKEIRKVVVDVGKMDYIASAGIRILLKLKKQIPDFRMIHVSPQIYEIISITGMEEVFGLKSMDDEEGEDDAPGEGTQDNEPTDLHASRKAARRKLPADFIPVTKSFEKQAELHPDHMAVVSSKGSYTYRELNEAANKVAHALLEMDAQPEDIVCLIMERSIDIYAATIGTLKAGCAYIVVNPKYPDDRIEYIYRDSGAKFIISCKDMVYDRLELFVDQLQKRPLFFEHIQSIRNVKNPDRIIYPENLCYLIYTSGSTGKPKGVMIEHGNLSNFLIDDPENHEFLGLARKSNRCLAMAQMTFDVSIMEEYIPLVSGNTVVFALYDEIGNPVNMVSLMETQKVDGVCVTPSYLSDLLRYPAAQKAVAALKVIDIGAEAFPATLYDRIRAWNPEVYIMNGYGPTEATISCTMKVVEDNKNITIGVPNANMEAYIIDDQNNELPCGETGELLICGKGVGRGYKNLPEKTKEVFIEFRGQRAYKTGDLARINKDGEIEYLGRKDFQVKIRGLRIELGEVEAILSEMKKIDICVASSVEGRYLCLYYTSRADVTEQEVREYAREHLAHYMIPDLYVKLEEMPLTDNGKADRKALPKPEVKEEAVREPETETQKKILEILQSVMEDSRFGIDENLPEKGMSSLDTMLFISLLGDEFKIGMNLSDFLTHPTIIKLEQFIQKKPKLRNRKKLEKYHATFLQASGYQQSLSGEMDSNLPMLYGFDLSIDEERLKEAVYATMEVHPGLTQRLELDADGTLYQIPQSDFRDYEIKTINTEDDLLEKHLEELTAPIPANGKWLFRFEIINTPSHRYLFANYSHLSSDGESMNIVIEDILKAYEGKKLKGERMTMQEYGEYLHDFWDSKAGKRCNLLYDNLLREAKPITLKADKTDGVWTPKHSSVPLEIDPSELKEYCAKNHFTESTVMAGATGLVLSKREDGRAISCPFGFSGRNDSRLSDTVGYIATILVCACRPEKHNTFKDYLRDFDQTMRNLMTYPIMPIEKAAAEYPNFLDTVYVFQPYSPEEYDLEGTRVTARSLQEATTFKQIKLTVQYFQEKDGSITLSLDYHANLYEDSTITAFAEDIRKVVEAMLKDVPIKDVEV
ncbi:MAG: amino acid adenylation domain-containing protein [Acetatifactor sp.]|nr:amino acid adenylation domain-containing protein [Acetatifactor sp.]